MVLNSGFFGDLMAGQVGAEWEYSIADYLTLLNTYSPYLKLPAAQKAELFAGLERVLRAQGDRVYLSNLCGFHIARLLPKALPDPQ
jgi:hypothetical protein